VVARSLEFRRWATAGNVKLLLPPRQSRGASLGRLDDATGRDNDFHYTNSVDATRKKLGFRMNSKELIRTILFEPILFFLVLLIIRAIFFTTLELVSPARKVMYRSVLLNDLTACFTYAWLVFPLAAYLNSFVPGYHPYPVDVGKIPLALRVVLYFALADFGHYWIHRMMHGQLLWRVHKWHHTPTYMYWLGGVRATVPQQFLVNIPYVLAYPVLDPSPWWIPLAVVTVSTVQNDWVHLNVGWRTKLLEWIIVTPRFHHIHHSAEPLHYMANMGNIFSIWDRLFGTYI
jgi:sterol desaturase/sphingolipid hydroxylase (fatty acid hydroxylase superfamily)